MRYLGISLSFLGRFGPLFLIMSLLAGISWPDLAELARGALPISAFLLTLGSFLTADLAEAEDTFGFGRWMFALGWIGFGVPLVVCSVLSTLNLQPALVTGVVLSVLAPPVGSAAAIAGMLGLRPRQALITSISLTIASPILMPLLARGLASGTVIDGWMLAGRLTVIIGSAALVAALVRRFRRHTSKILPDGQAAAGIAVIGLVIVGLAIAFGLRSQFAIDRELLGRLLLGAIAINVGIGFVGTVFFCSWGARDALTVGLVSGNRNVTLAWAAAGTSLPALSEAYLATCVIPILTLPLVIKTYVSLRRRIGRQRAALVQQNA